MRQRVALNEVNIVRFSHTRFDINPEYTRQKKQRLGGVTSGSLGIKPGYVVPVHSQAGTYSRPGRSFKRSQTHCKTLSRSAYEKLHPSVQFEKNRSQWCCHLHSLGVSAHLGGRGSEKSSKNSKTKQVGKTKVRHIQSSYRGFIR